MDGSSPISISEALNHLQSWLNAGEYDKVVQGCTEILQIEPGNQRALSLMKRAEEARSESEPAGFANAAPTPPAPNLDALESLQVESAPPREHREKTAPGFATTASDSHKFFLAMWIPAVLVVVLGAGLIWYVLGEKRDDLLADNTQTDVTDSTEKNSDYLEQNDRRVQDMQKISDILKTYEEKNGKYPTLKQIDEVLLAGGFKSLPVDPKQGEIDKAGKEFGYVYSVYSAFGKDYKSYILSALFEDSKGFGYPWTMGAPSKNHPDYRDVDEDHATYLGEK